MTRKEVIKSYKIAIKGLLDKKNYDVTHSNKIQINLNDLSIDINCYTFRHDIFVMINVTKEHLSFSVSAFSKTGRCISRALKLYYKSIADAILPIIETKFKLMYGTIRGGFKNEYNGKQENFKLYWNNGSMYLDAHSSEKDVSFKLSKRSKLMKLAKRLHKERKGIVEAEKQKALDTLYTKLFEEI